MFDKEKKSRVTLGVFVFTVDDVAHGWRCHLEDREDMKGEEEEKKGTHNLVSSMLFSEVSTKNYDFYIQEV